MRGESLSPSQQREILSTIRWNRKVNPLDPIIDSLSPGDVIHLHRYLKDAWDDLENRNDPNEDYLSPLRYATEQSIGELPKRNLEHARAVYTGLADSPDINDRVMAGLVVGDLTHVDYEYGLPLWHRLIRDINGDVRDAANFRIVDWFEEDVLTPPTREQQEQRATKAGITWHDALWLHQTYLAAEEGHNLYDPQGAVLMRTLGLLHLAQGGQ
jgi:hypothetical protein